MNDLGSFIEVLLRPAQESKCVRSGLYSWISVMMPIALTTSPCRFADAFNVFTCTTAIMCNAYNGCFVCKGFYVHVTVVMLKTV